MFLTQRRLSRRTVLRGVGASLALPFLDAMVPAAAGRAASPRTPPRLVCIEMVHGAAGSARHGIEQHLWSPAATGRPFDLSPTSLAPLEPFRDVLTIVSNTDVPSADPFSIREIGGDHFRSSAVFLTQAHPKRTAGPDVEAGVSIDQVHAQRFGQDTPIPSLQLCIEDVNGGGGCGHGYSCVYTDSISWASPTRPLPMIRNPRTVFEMLAGAMPAGGSGEEARARRRDDRSILDWIVRSAARLRSDLGARDRVRLDEYLDSVREVERRIQATEARNGSGEPRALPDAPAGVPDSFAAHVQLMFDLQLLAFESDLTRVVSFKMGRDNSNRVYPESGVGAAFHVASHHGDRPERVLDFAKINRYHVGLLPYFLHKLRDRADGAGTLLDNTLLLYGSPMGDSNAHNHQRVPFVLAGRLGGRIAGERHVAAPRGTPLANAMVSVLHALGHEQVETFGDSEGVLDLSPPA